MNRFKKPAEAGGASLRVSRESLQAESSDFFLTPEEVELVTGRRQFASQRRHLRRIGMAFRVDADGRPVVTRGSFERYEHVEDQPGRPGRVNMPQRQPKLKGPAL